MSTPTSDPTWAPLTPRERRVVGVLVEKQKTTPDVYPMTLNALVNGCNQKSNRDPVVNYNADDVEEALHGLRKKGAAVLYEGMGRVEKWKHTLYDWLNLKSMPTEMAVLAELLLRGPQTEGDLRARASRMAPLPDLTALQQALDRLDERGLIVYLSPPGQRRGVVVTHALYPPEELEKVRRDFARAPFGGDEPATTTAATTAAHRTVGANAAAADVAALRGDLDALRAEFNALRAQVESLADALRALNEALGA